MTEAEEREKRAAWKLLFEKVRSMEWTRTPPSEPGWYWARGGDLDQRGEAVRWDKGTIGGWYALRPGHDPSYALDLAEGGPTCTGWIWWSTPIEPPRLP